MSQALAHPLEDADETSFHETIIRQGEMISDKLNLLRIEHNQPHSARTLRGFSLAEAAYFLGVTPSNLKKLHLEGKGPTPATSPSGRRTYSAEQMLELRAYLDRHGRSQVKRYLPRRRAGEHLQVVSVINFKGGSAKTTTAAHLAQYLALTGHRVLVVDLDPQASLTALHGIQPEIDKFPSLYEALRYDDQRQPISNVIRRTSFPDLDIVPAGLELQEYEHDTPLALTNRAAGDGRLFFTRVTHALKEVEDRYDVVVVDCPPQLGYLTLTALTASTSVLITIHPQMLDVMSMSQFLRMTADLMDVIADSGADMSHDWMRYLLTRYEPTDAPQNRIVAFLRTMYGDKVLNAPMLKSTAISDAGLTKQTLYEVERSAFTRTTYDRAVESLNAVNDEIAQLIQRTWGR